MDPDLLQTEIALSFGLFISCELSTLGHFWTKSFKLWNTKEILTVRFITEKVHAATGIELEFVASS